HVYFFQGVATGPLGSPGTYVPKWYGGGSSCQASGTVHVTVSSTATANIDLGQFSATGFKIGGHILDDVSSKPVPYVYVFFYKQGSSASFFAFADGCGKYATQGLTAGTYDAQVFGSGYRTTTFMSAFTITSSDVTKDFGIPWTWGGISGFVMSGGNPVQGAEV